MKKYNLLILLMIGLFVQSCADLDDVNPVNEIDSSLAINSLATATAAVNGIYDEMQDPTLRFDGFLALAQFFSDEANATGTFPTRLEFGNVNVFPANTTAAAVFSDLYDAINVANNVIEKVPLVEDIALTDAAKADFVGQAKFIRAHCYLHLATLWGDVPLILTPTTEIGEVLFVPKSSVPDIYTQIKSDLSDAARDVIDETGPGGASTVSYTHLTLPTNREV